jgi:hypothetical protein
MSAQAWRCTDSGPDQLRLADWPACSGRRARVLVVHESHPGSLLTLTPGFLFSTADRDIADRARGVTGRQLRLRPNTGAARERADYRTRPAAECPRSAGLCVSGEGGRTETTRRRDFQALRLTSCCKDGCFPCTATQTFPRPKLNWTRSWHHDDQAASGCAGVLKAQTFDSR